MSTQLWYPEEGDPHRAASLDDRGQGVLGALDDLRAHEKWDPLLERAQLQLAATEEIKICGFPVTEMQSQRRFAVQHKVSRDRNQFRPEAPLCLRQNIESGEKTPALRGTEARSGSNADSTASASRPAPILFQAR
jgi:hypothetical protein